ncbi:MAG: hypothetical protein AAGF25_04670 [Pseudomonadota bacterium]
MPLALSYATADHNALLNETGVRSTELLAGFMGNFTTVDNEIIGGCTSVTGRYVCKKSGQLLCACNFFGHLALLLHPKTP